MSDKRDKSELILPPHEFAHVQDMSKGEIATYVGPHKASLSGDDVPMVFDETTKRFKAVDMSDAKQSFITAPAGWYAEVLNPVLKHPRIGTKNGTPDDMQIGKKIVIPGPCSFALWPGQMAKVVKGHRLRSSEYLIIEVYDVEAARKKWSETVVETTKADEDISSIEDGGGAADKKGTKDEKNKSTQEEKISNLLSSIPDDLANGKRYIIKGTDVAFYIPPSGVKVVKDGDEYIRKAVTLEKLEYAVLRDENGEKEYVYGPNVVFPEPTQSFITDSSGQNKFKAIELDARKGIYVKVIESYIDEDTKQEYKEGDELFITGEGLIYFPRKEHSIIKYGDQEIHYATAIPKGESRYVLNRKSGDVFTVPGPKMYLPNPIDGVITRRILTEREAKLFFPDNKKVLEMNRLLTSKYKSTSPEDLALNRNNRVKTDESFHMRSALSDNFIGDSFERKNTYTQPRTVVLDTEYQGAILINVWTGYAVKVVDKSGKGRVVEGPDAIHLEYDETLEPMQLSTGTPKNSDNLIETAYLKIRGNRVSDKVLATTADLVDVGVKLGYRVNFEGSNPLLWFSSENYIKLLCDHISSVLKSVIRKHKIDYFYANSTEIIRDAILGEKPEEGDRKGMFFKENNMRVYDVEVFDPIIGDREVQTLLSNAQYNSITKTLKLADRELEVSASKALEKLNQEELQTKRETEQAKHRAEIERIQEQHEEREKKLSNARKAEKAELDSMQEMAKTKFDHEEKLKMERVKQEESRLKLEKTIKDKQREIKAADYKIDEDHEKAIMTLLLEAQKFKTESAETIAKAFTPQMVEAINTLRDAKVLEILSEKFGDLSVLEGKGLMATATRFLDVIPQDLIPKLKSLIPVDGEVAKADNDLSKKSD